MVIYGYLKNTYERPRNWTKIEEEFDLIDDLISKAYLLPIRVASEPYLRSFQYKVLNSILFTNDILYKIGFVLDPNCCFCKRNKETANHLFFSCSFSYSFWSGVTDKILKKLDSCECLLLRDFMIGILKEEMDLVNYVIILGKNYLWTCRQKVIKPSFSHFKRILVNKYETENHIACKLNKTDLFRKKWKLYEKFFSRG